MAEPLDITLKASGNETSGSSGAAVDIEAIRNAVTVDLTVTALGGTDPVLTLYIDSAPSDSGPWSEAVSVTASATGQQSVAAVGLGRYVRARWAIDGTDTPNFTFSVAGQAKQAYATLRDLDSMGISAKALSALSLSDKSLALIDASYDAMAGIGGAFTLPITGWGNDLRRQVVGRACFYLMQRRGINPGSNSDRLILLQGGFVTEDGMPSAFERWLKMVATGAIKPFGIVDQTPETYEASFAVESEPRRGW